MSQSITKEFLKSFFDKYTYNPMANLSARWALLWCSLLLVFGIIHIIEHDNPLVMLIVDGAFGLMVIFLYPTLGATGTIHRSREETIKSYSKNLEGLVLQKTQLLSKSEEKYRTLFEIVPAGMFRVNEDLQIVDINKCALNLIGMSDQEVIGRRCLDVICKREGKCRLAQSSLETVTEEISLDSPSGGQNFVVISCRNWKIEGKATIIGSITNINERKKLETTILEHNFRLESIFDGMDDGIVAIDKDFTVATINRKQAGFLGSSPEKLIGRKCKEVIHPTCEEIARKVFLSGEKIRKEIVLKDKEGKEVHEDIIYAPIKNKEGGVEQVIEVLRDITEKKQMENLLLRSERLASMGEIAACVAHEINNPMGIILGFTQRLLGRVKGSLDQEELKIIEQECIRCGKIIKDLLEFARPSIPQKRLLDVEEIITNSLKLLEFQINKRKVRVMRNLAHVSKIEIDPHQFQQVLMNIFLNAIQAMPNGGELHISVYNENEYNGYPHGSVGVRIEDTGIGIPEENLPRVIEPFFSTKRDGTGLGLSLSKRIVDAHGGNLALDSEIGKGTRVIITLPL